VPRATPNQQLQLKVNGTPQRMELLADVTANALQYERDIYFKELGKALVRLAIKKISELALAEKKRVCRSGFGFGKCHFRTSRYEKLANLACTDSIFSNSVKRG
jgi:hypothetical protein